MLPLSPLSLKVKENVYSVPIPTIGQIWDIEEKKAILSNGTYGLVLTNGTIQSKQALDTLDMFVYLSVFVPQLITDLKVGDWRELNVFDVEELRRAYLDQFIPWFDDFDNLLKKAKETKVDASTPAG